MSEKLLTIREVAGYLGCTEKEIIDLAEDGTIPAYKVGGVFLRFKRDQVEEFRKKLRADHKQQKVPLRDKLLDLWYFNDFYLVALLVLLALVYIVLFT